MPRANAITSRLAARLSVRQIELLAAADDAADDVDRAIVSLWDQLMQLLTHPPHGHGQRRHAARMLLHGMLVATQRSLHGSLRDLVIDGHDSAADVLATTLPGEVLNAARRFAHPARAAQSILTLPRLESRYCAAVPGTHRLIEAKPGAVQLGITGAGRLSVRDRLAGLREPVAGQLSDEERRRRFRETLLPPPSAEQVDAILRRPVFGSTWQQDLTQASRIAGFDPERMVSAIANGMALGQAPQQIAKQLLPVVSGVKTSARRIARTYGMQVAHVAQMQAHAQLGDMVIGYTVLATLDQHTRAWHATRSGTIYYREPKEGQKGLAQMPNPPLEAEDPRERPAGTPRTAWHCRCWIAPVLAFLEGIVGQPEFENAAGELIPDPATYSDWWQQADERRRKLAVGVRRYETMRQQLGSEPDWHHFVDPVSGGLLPTKDLEQEPITTRVARVQDVRKLIARNRQQAADVTRYGFLPTSPPAVPAPVSVQQPLPKDTLNLTAAQRSRLEQVRAEKIARGEKPIVRA